ARVGLLVELADSSNPFSWSIRVAVKCCIFADFRDCSGLRRHDGTTPRHRFDGRQPKAFDPRRKEKTERLREGFRQVIVAQATEQSKVGGLFANLFSDIVLAYIADDRQIDAHVLQRWQERKCKLQVLVGLRLSQARSEERRVGKA